jgi:hypothetical protein
VKLIANNDHSTHDYLLLYKDVQFMAQWLTSTHEEKEILESFSCELLLRLCLHFSFMPMKHCYLTTMDIFFV